MSNQRDPKTYKYKTPMKQRQQRMSQYAQRRKKGLCTWGRCKNKSDSMYCKYHGDLMRKKIREQGNAWLKEGRCYRCGGKPLKTTINCAECARVKCASTCRKYARRKAANVCIDCGSTQLDTMRWCARCAERHRGGPRKRAKYKLRTIKS